MPMKSSIDSPQSRPRRSLSHSPTRERLIEDAEGTTRPVRRGRKPTNKRPVAKKTETLDLDNSFHSSTSSFHNSLPIIPSEDLNFLTKSPAGHQWRNKKLWQTNANLTQKRYEEYSGKKLCATPQAMEREMRRRDIRDAMLGVMDMEVPDL